MSDKGYDRMSTILGHPCRIVQPLGTPKSREECQPFTYALVDVEGAYRPEDAKVRQAKTVAAIEKELNRKRKTVRRKPSGFAKFASLPHCDQLLAYQRAIKGIAA